ncbi:hypothetical protein AKJ40_03180 [candidate division MSBL1 archaeon SCGC-AAA259M10]|uniref:2Fe-2S ferredoxin-type domain-containing protein n=1 Tax=candidate division MSBL1 archaeon SCGC-AAA259M10 TaxID=1698270 RepID=A0A133UYZ8_9EURY|nr:hypothetical protein AKJ40_03180 [candidate division MSBL1 archaeon SCGC-AAA259M10]
MIEEKEKISLTVNENDYSVEVKPDKSLLWVLRNKLGLTGPKEGCGKGECGACTVLLDDSPVNSCLVLAVQADGKEVVTIEGIADGDELHPIQESFIEKGAIQCGFCTPGMIVTAKSLLDENPNPTEKEIKKYIAGNICRCTGYSKIIDAIKHASKKMSSSGGD